MAIGSGVPYNVHTGNGVTTTFAYGFTVLAAADLVATVDGAVTGVTVSGVGDAAGGSVAFSVAPADGAQIILRRVLDLVRLVEYQRNGDLLAATINADFDRLLMMIQGIDADSSRSVRAPFPEELDDMPASTSRAGALLSFDSDGQPDATSFSAAQVAAAITAAGFDGVTAAHVSSTSQQTVSAGTTVITVPTYTPGVGAIALYADGVRLLRAEFTETNATTVTLAAPFASDVELEVVIGRLVTSGVDADEIVSTDAGANAVAVGLNELLEDLGDTLKKFGGDDDGVTDNLAAFNAAVAAGYTVIYAPGANYYFSAGITVPENVALIGGACMPTNPPAGTRFTFALATAVCVTLGGTAAANGSGRLQNLTVTRAAGTIPSGSIGVKVDELYGATVEDVMSHRHSIGFKAEGDADTQGIAYMFTRCWTGVITDAHVVIDTVPECRFSQCRFGMNGSGDQNCTAFVRVTGGSTSNASNGPNSLVFSNCQFNQGANTATSWIEFVSKTGGTISDTRLWQIDTCYVETVSYGITSDNTWDAIERLQISNTTFNVAVPFLNLDAATTISNWAINNNLIFGSFTLAPNDQIDFGHIANCEFLGAVSLTGPTSGSTASLADCNFAGGLTLAGQWGSLQVCGGSISSGSLTNTATGYVNVDLFPKNTLRTFTPTIQFGGGSTGVTYGTQAGVYREIGGVVYAQFRVTLTAKGSDTGAARVVLTGLPAVSSEAYSLGNSGATAYALNMASLGTSPVSGFVGSGPVVNLYLATATGITSATEGNFTNTSDVAMAITYVRA